MKATIVKNGFSTTFEIKIGDITKEPVDAIVNAANEHLQHGGGVAAAISRAAGPVLQKESNEWIDEHGTVSHEEPAFSGAGKLPARYVIHAVGPVWGSGHEHEKLEKAISGSSSLAEKLDCTSIAFPAISTGIFGFPIDQAAQVFKKCLIKFINTKSKQILDKIVIVLYDEHTYSIFENEFSDFEQNFV